MDREGKRMTCCGLSSPSTKEDSINLQRSGGSSSSLKEPLSERDEDENRSSHLAMQNIRLLRGRLVQ